MKYLISIGIAVVLVFSLISCQQGSDKVPELISKEEAVKEAAVTINKDNASKAAEDLLKEIQKEMQ
ncbi:MAG: hypothetical protein KKH98_13195 [Spirochaetes bacterium]|nr:hypothetical protein [Spirochaetota bacterium]